MDRPYPPRKRYEIQRLEGRLLLTHAVQDFGFIVNELKGFDQTCDVASDADGDFVVVWEGRPDPNTIARDMIGTFRLPRQATNPGEGVCSPPTPRVNWNLQMVPLRTRYSR